MFLVGDIGGTHTRLALFENRNLVEEKEFPSPQFSSLEEIIQAFVQKKIRISKAAFGVAGPVQEGLCKTTNLPWTIDAKKIEKINGINTVFLLNDLQAHAYGIGALKEKEVLFLQRAKKIFPGNRALVSPGTGLGEAGLFWDGKKYHPFASEGGHTDFACRNEKEFLLLQFLQEKYGHVSYERVVSGPGLEDLFSFLTEREKKKAKLSPGENNLAKEITQKALSKECPVCLEAVEWFVSFYAAEAANVALQYLCFSGIYLGGGIAPKILPFLQKPLFLQAFLNKGRFNKLLENMPVKVILNDKTALLGALEYVLS